MGAWIRPRVLSTPTGQPLYVERPDVLDVGGATVLVGTPVFRWHLPSVFRDTTARSAREFLETQRWMGVILRRDGAVQGIPFPAAAARVRNPMAVASPRSGAVVFWSEAPDSTSNHSVYAREIWAGRLAGSRIVGRTRVAAAAVIAWYKGLADATTVMGAPAFAAPASDTLGKGGRGGVLYVRQTEGRWKQNWIDTRTLPHNVSLTALDGRPVVAFIGTYDATGLPKTQGIFVVRSLDDGTRWQQPVLVHEFPPDRYANDVKLISTGDGDLHLLWTVRELPRFDAREVTHLVLRAGSNLWTPGPALHLDQGTNMLEVLSPASGELLALTTTPGKGAAHLSSLHAGATRWITEEVPFGEGAASVPTLDLVSGRVMVTAGVARQQAPTSNERIGVPLLLIAERPLSCGARHPAIAPSR